jgi:hypothetical protein
MCRPDVIPAQAGIQRHPEVPVMRYLRLLRRPSVNSGLLAMTRNPRSFEVNSRFRACLTVDLTQIAVLAYNNCSVASGFEALIWNRR